MTDADLALAYKQSMNNRVAVLRSDACGCFRCLSVFEPSDVKTWIDTGQTAVCPRCGMDAVIGSASGFEVTGELLDALQDRWFPAAQTA